MGIWHRYCDSWIYHTNIVPLSNICLINSKNIVESYTAQPNAITEQHLAHSVLPFPLTNKDLQNTTRKAKDRAT
jgi:hypothetical protein